MISTSCLSDTYTKKVSKDESLQRGSTIVMTVKLILRGLYKFSRDAFFRQKPETAFFFPRGQAFDPLIFLLGLSLVVICSSENEDRAHMAAALDQYRLGTIPHCAAPKDIRQYLQTQFKSCPQTPGRFQDKVIPWAPAAMLDKQK